MLIKAIEDGDLSALSDLVALASPGDRYAGLMASISARRMDMVELLLTEACPLDQVVNNDFPLAAAARTGDLALVERLLDQGASINTQSSAWWERLNQEGEALCRDGVSALLEAIRYQHEGLLPLLIKRGADLNQKTSRVRRPLDFAIERGCGVALLERAGAERVRLEDYSLTEAAQHGVIPRLEQLLNSTPDELARALANAALNKRAAAVRFLQSHGVRLKDSSILVSKARYEHLPTLIALLEGEVDVNLPSSENGDLALGAASSSGNLETIKLLLRAGARLDGLDRKGLPALHYALLNRHFEVAELLLDEGADPLSGEACLRHTLARLDEGARAQAWALFTHKLSATQVAQLKAPIDSSAPDPTAPFISPAIRMLSQVAEAEAGLRHHLTAGTLTAAKLVKYLGVGSELDLRDDQGMWLKDPEGRSLLHLAVSFDRARVVSQCLKAGMPVILRDQGGLTPLHLARSVGVINQLVEAGADPNERGSSGERPLHFCAVSQAARRLIELGADPSLTDDEGEPPWVRHVARASGAVIRAHAEGGVDFNQARYGGQSALHLAALGGHLNVIRELIALQVDPLITNDLGQRASTVARHLNHLELLDALVEAGGEPELARFTLKLDPKRQSISSLLKGLEPTALSAATLEALKESGALGRLLAQAIAGAPLDEYFMAVRLQWSPHDELAPAFVEYITETLHLETLGAGPWEMYGAARAHLAGRDLYETLKSELPGELPGLCVGAQGPAELWLLARRFKAQERGGWLITQDQAERHQLAQRLMSELSDIEPTQLRRALIEGLQREAAYLDIIDVITLFRAYKTGEDDPQRSLLAALCWDEARRSAAQSTGALRFIDRAPLPLSFIPPASAEPFEVALDQAAQSSVTAAPVSQVRGVSALDEPQTKRAKRQGSSRSSAADTRYIVAPGELSPRHIEPPDPVALEALTQRSLEQAQAEARAAQRYRLSDEALIKASYELYQALQGAEERAPLMALGFDWLTFKSRLDELIAAERLTPLELPLRVELGQGQHSAELQELLWGLRADLDQLRALGPHAFKAPQQIPARLRCVTPDARLHCELSLAPSEPIFFVNLNDSGSLVQGELAHLTAHPRIRAIWLSSGQLTSEALATVDFASLKELQVLDLSYNQLKAAPPSLSGCAALEWLDLSFNLTLELSAEVFSACESLRYLDLRGSAVSASLLAELRAAHPGCEVLI